MMTTVYRIGFSRIKFHANVTLEMNFKGDGSTDAAKYEEKECWSYYG